MALAAASGSAQPAQAQPTQVQPTQAEPEPTERQDPVEAALTVPAPRSFLELVELFGTRREGELYAHLHGGAHLVRFGPGRVELRLDAGAPRDLVPRVMRLLSEWTGQRWILTLSNEPGAPTLAEQARLKEADRHEQASRHPVVQALLETFPGARITAVRDLTPPASATAGSGDPEVDGSSAAWDGQAPLPPDEESSDDEEYR